MKHDWPFQKLENVAQVIAGQSPHGSTYNQNSIGTPFYQGKKDYGERYLLPPTVWTTQETKIAEPGDLLVSVRAPVGALNFTDQRICIGRGLAAIRTHKLLPTFLFYVLSNLSIKGKDGAVFASINRSDIESIVIPVPPISEQERIVGILDEAFAKIDAVKRNAERNLQNAKELFQQSLAKAMEPKEGWISCSLDGIGVIKTGKTPPTSHREFFGNDVPFVTPADISFFAPITYRSNGLSYAGIRYSSLISPGATLMVCIGASIGKVAYSEKQITMNQQINAIIPSDRYCNKFITYALCTQRFQKQVKDNAGQTTLPIISKSKWSKLLIGLPSDKKVQEGIAFNLDYLVQNNKQMQDNYDKVCLNCDELKKAILTQAFNGEL